MSAFAIRAGSASLFALITILSIGPAAAAEGGATASQEQCAEYLKDLATYRLLATMAGCKLPEDKAAAAEVSTQPPLGLVDELSQAPQQVASVESESTNFPPVVEDAPVAEEQEFPPVVEEASTPSAPASTEMPPVEEASAEPAQFPPVVKETDGAPSSSGGGLPPVVSGSGGMGDVGMEDPADPTLREAIKEKLVILKEAAKERVREAIILKTEEVKEHVKQKIKNKIEAAIEQHSGGDAGPAATLRRTAAPSLRRAAKDVIKRAIVERHQGGLMSKLSQLRRR